MSKFNSPLDEHAYLASFDTGYDSGDVSAPTGWFARVDLNLPDDDTALAVQTYGSPFVIVREDEQGFVSVIGFPSELERDRAFDRLELAYSLWDAEITDVQLLSAVTAYERCALWSSTDAFGVPFDDGEYEFFEWDEEAHQRNVADVAEFLISNIEEIRAFMEVTGCDFGGVGHDFWLTRNRHGAGFWDRGAAGPAVDTLVESSHAWGEVNIFATSEGKFISE